MGSAYQFHSWRVFVVVCALPCVSAVVALTFMPESPRFYLEVRETRARTLVAMLGEKLCVHFLLQKDPAAVHVVLTLMLPFQTDR